MLVRRPGIDVIHLGVRGMLVLNKAIAKRNGDQIVFFSGEMECSNPRFAAHVNLV